MIRDRYDPVNLFRLVPQLQLEMEPTLAQLDPLLDDDQLFQAVKADLAAAIRIRPRFGRPSTPVEVILRMLVVKHLYHWSYEQAEQFVSDSLVLRQFCRVYACPRPTIPRCCAVLPTGSSCDVCRPGVTEAAVKCKVPSNGKPPHHAVVLVLRLPK